MGKVYLVGAGPGDKELITVRGAKLIELANVIVYDQLANKELLKLAPKSCEFIYAGKKAGNHAMKQEDINKLLIKLSKEYDHVIRLKGGDPYVFGRGSEEGEALYESNTFFEVVPGISSSIGGLCYGGIPVTSRNIATSFHVITGHTSNPSEDIQYEALAKLSGTLVFLMGVGNIEHIVSSLIKFKKDANTPVAIIYKATSPEQIVTIGVLDNIVQKAKENQLKAPSVIVIGDVVNHREALSFFEKRPLFGKKILVTRSREVSSKMSDALTELGGHVVELPGTKIVSLNEDKLMHTLKKLNQFSAIVFTSGVAVEIFFETLKKLKLDVRQLVNIKFIVIGKETEKVLASHDLYADFIPNETRNQGLIELIKNNFSNEDHLLIPRSAKGDVMLVKELESLVKLSEIHIYDSEINQDIDIETQDLEDLDYITFTSSSTVDGFVHYLRSNNMNINAFINSGKIVAIGPTTRKTLENYQIKVHLQPKEYTIASMISCIVDEGESI